MSDNITVSVDFVTPKTSKLDSSIQSVLHTDYHFHAKSNIWKKSNITLQKMIFIKDTQNM